MSNRPDDGYQVRSRIEGRSSGRSRLALVVLAVVAVGWLFATLTNRPGPVAEASLVPTARSTATPTAEPTRLGRPVATAEEPPLITALPGAPAAAFPVMAGSLLWVHPAMSAVVEEVQPDWTQWPFLLSDGTSVCVCLESRSGPGAPNRLHIDRRGAEGEPLDDTIVEGWSGERASERSFVDAALTPDGLAAIVAVASLDRQVWWVTLDRIDLSGAQPQVVATASISKISAAELDRDGVRTIRVWVSPDGKLARVLTTDRSPSTDERPSPGSTTTYASIETGTFGPSDAVRRGDDERPQCMPAGWATPRDFVSICGDDDAGAAGPDLTVRRESIDGTTDGVVLGSLSELDGASWAIDATSGVLFGWVSRTGDLFRVEVPSLAVVSRRLNLFGLDGLRPDGPPPEPRPGRANWTSNTWPRWPSTLVGSPDGSLLYAAGTSTATVNGRDTPITTGVYTFDARTLRLVGNAGPAASYTSIGITADGSYVLGVGENDPTNVGTGGVALVAHDARTGEVVLILRRIESRIGGYPGFLVPRPGPDIGF